MKNGKDWYAHSDLILYTISEIKSEIMTQHAILKV